MDKAEALVLIAQEIEQCELCKQNTIGVAVPVEGNPNADVIFIGEAPGKQEAETGRPFIGRSGKLLRSLIREVGLDDEKDVYITSPVKYLPVHVTPTPKEIAHGRTHLMKQFAVIEPKLIVLLGSTAIQAVLEQKVPVMKEHGKIIEKDGKKYFLTIHPAAVLRNPPTRPVMLEDFKKLKAMLGN